MFKNNAALFIMSMKVFGIIQGLYIFLQIITKLSVRLPGIEHLVHLRKGTSDIATFYQVFLKKEYNFLLEETPKLIIDGGANIGLFAIQMINKYPECKIICIEPDPENFFLLQKNTRFYKNISCQNTGLWSKDTKLKVFDKFGGGKWGMCVEEDLAGGLIDAICIGSLFKQHSIEFLDVLKLDVEGSEKCLFTDSVDEWLPKVKTIVIEFHDRLEKGTAQPFFKAINNCFDEYGFEISGENAVITNNSSDLKSWILRNPPFPQPLILAS